MKHRVKYTAQGLLSGKNVGDVVQFDEADTRHLMSLGLIETEADYQARQKVKAQAEADLNTEKEDGVDAEEILQANADLKAEVDRLTAQVEALGKSSQENSAHFAQALEGVKAEHERAKESAASLAEAHQKLEAEHRAFQDLVLSPYAGKGGWYAFPAAEEGGEEVKVRGRDAALEEFAKRQTAAEAGESQ